MEAESLSRVASHVKLALILTCDPESQPLIEPQSGVDLCHTQAHCVAVRSGFGKQLVHCTCADSSSLKRAVDKKLGEKKLILPLDTLYPPYV